jgi:hypothetical protein
MADRWRAPGGWSVQVVDLSVTPDKRDGEWLRVSYRGWWVADVRSVAELEQWFPVADLEPDGLVLVAWRTGADASNWAVAGSCSGS